MAEKNVFENIGGFFAGAADAAGKAANEAGKAVAGAASEAGKVASDVAGKAGKAVNSLALSIDGLGASSEESTIKNEDGTYNEPIPIVDDKEKEDLEIVSRYYEKITKPSSLDKLGEKVNSIIPQEVKDALGGAGDAIKSQEYYMAALDNISKGFKVVEEQASRFTVSSQVTINDINKSLNGKHISSIDEICFLRSYEIKRAVNTQNIQHLVLAATEGAATGAPGFAGIPFNLVLSTLLYFRAVQKIALFYGYDVKNDPDEMEYAGKVFQEALSGGKDSAKSQIGKIMMAAEGDVIKKAAAKGWAAMIERGGIPLLVAQMRALSHKAAKNALEKAGQKNLEQSVFRSVFEQIGKKLGLKSVGKAVPVIGGVIGALFDTAQMNQVLKFSEMFYRKRFILEKEVRIAALQQDCTFDEYLDVDFDETSFEEV